MNIHGISESVMSAESLVRRLQMTVARQEKALAETKAQLEAALKLAGIVITKPVK